MRVVAFLLFAALLPAHAAEPEKKDKGKPNRLAKESSPYLLQHAHNPVDWYPWGPEAFEKAKKEKKLVFLSIGYSSCHWCHVMERESFSNADVAKLLNENFICIKVDREERPDVDDVYMTALNVSGQSGGWPLSMFLTPEAKPIFGGTYFPPDDRKDGDDTIPGFKSILKKVMELHTKEKDGLYKQADHIAEETADALERSTRLVALVTLTRESYTFDPEHGGTGNKKESFRGTKFPRAAVWSFLLEQSRKKGNEELAKSVQLTLRKMAEGGIYDQLGGGFHRYSTERTWTVPHFEKMLYDNAQLVELYSEAYRTNPDPMYKRVVAETLGYIQREMTSPDGAFYSALDADSNHKEGEFYVWTTDEIKTILGNDADVAFFRGVYGVTAPNFEEKFHILKLPKPLAEVAKEQKLTEAELLAKLEPMKAKLMAVRAKRERPFLDTKIITSWNGQMIAGWAKAGEVFQNKSFTDAAAKAADFLLRTMRTKDGRLMRLYAAVPGEKASSRGSGYLEDYSFLVHGLLNLHDATKDKKWLDEAKAFTDAAMKHHGDLERGGFYFTAHDHEKLFARAKDGYDGAQPSGNGVMARNLIRLWRKTEDLKYRDFGFRTIKTFALVLRTNPGSAPGMARALDELLDIAEKDPTAIEPKNAVEPKKLTGSATKTTAKLELGEAKDGKLPFTVKLTVEKDWYLYANSVGNKMYEANATSVEVRIGGKVVEAAVTYPKGEVKKDKDGDFNIHTGSLTITGVVPRAANGGEVEVWVSVNACSMPPDGKPGVCLPTSVLKLK